MTWPLERPVTDATTPVTDVSPVAFWRFENDLTDDASVGPYDLSLIAGTETYADGGNQKTVFSFDGSTYMDATGYTGITGSNPRAISVWVKTTSVSGAIVWWGTVGPGQRWNLVLNAIGQVRVEVGGGFAVGTQDVTDGEWHHIVAMLESGDNNINQVVMYVDAVLETISSANSKVVDTTPNNDVRVGPFNGLMDELVLVDELISSEITAIYQGGRTADENGYNYKESTDEWVTTDLPRSGGRYKTQLITVSDQGKIYFGNI